MVNTIELKDNQTAEIEIINVDDHKSTVVIQEEAEDRTVHVAKVYHIHYDCLIYINNREVRIES